MRTWRKEPVRSVRSGAITSWRLVAGRAGDRVRLNLGNITEDQATLCEQAMVREERETYGTPAYDRVLRLAEQREVVIPGAKAGEPTVILGGGPGAVVQYLCGDAAIALLFGPPPLDYGKMTVEEYFDEVVALLDAADPMHRAMWAVGVGQGPRPGELVRCHWEDIDWGNRTMLIRGTKTRESWDRVPMTPLTVRELRAYWVKLGQPKAAGIARKVTPYLLRHSFATLAYLLGVGKETTRRIGRRTSDDMLDDVYCRPRPADLVDRLGAFDLPHGEE